MGDRKLKIEQQILHQIGRALLLFAIALLQTSLAPTLWRFRADWVLVAVVVWTLLRGLVPGLRWAIYGGLALDVLGVYPYGSHPLALMLCVLVIVFITEPLDREHPLLVMACAMGAALLYNGVLALVQGWTLAPVPWPSYGLTVIAPIAILDTIIAIPAFAVLRRIERRGQPLIEV